MVGYNLQRGAAQTPAAAVAPFLVLLLFLQGLLVLFSSALLELHSW
jgi:hypothetical protein